MSLLFLRRGEDDLEHRAVTARNVARADGALLQVRRGGAALAVAHGAGDHLELGLRQHALGADGHWCRGVDVTAGLALGVRLALSDVDRVMRPEARARHGHALVIRQSGPRRHHQLRFRRGTGARDVDQATRQYPGTQ